MSENDTFRRSVRRHRAVTSRSLLAAVLLGIALLAPLGMTDYQMFIWAGTIYVAALAVTWDFFTGLTGYFNFGHLVLVGIAGYTTVLLNSEVGLPLWLTILTATLVTGVLGTVILAGPSLRLTGIYFAAITLIVMIWAENVIILFSDTTGGLSGYLFITNLGWELSDLLPIGLNSDQMIYYVSVLNLVVIVGLLVLFAKSDLGKVMLAVRQDETLLASLGISPTKFKITGFFIIAVMTGFTGAIWTHSIALLSPGTQLNLFLMVDIVIAAVIGGMGTILGPVIGIFILEGIDTALTSIHASGILADTIGVDVTEWRRVIWMSIALAFFYFVPEGLYPKLQTLFDGVDEYLEGRT